MLRLIGLIATLGGGAACGLGGLVAILAIMDTRREGLLSPFLIAGIGIYFCGKGIAVAGLGVLGFAQSTTVPVTVDQTK